MANFNRLPGNQVAIPTLYPQNVPIPTTNATTTIYRNANNGLLYTVSSAGIHSILGGDVWLDAGSFTYDQWQPNATNAGTLLTGITIPAGMILTSIAMKIVDWFQVGFPTILVTTTGANSGLGNPVAMGSAGDVGLTSVQFAGTDFKYISEDPKPLEIRLTTGGGKVIDEMTTGEFQLWYKLSTLA